MDVSEIIEKYNTVPTFQNERGTGIKNKTVRERQPKHQKTSKYRHPKEVTQKITRDMQKHERKFEHPVQRSNIYKRRERGANKEKCRKKKREIYFIPSHTPLSHGRIRINFKSERSIQKQKKKESQIGANIAQMKTKDLQKVLKRKTKNILKRKNVRTPRKLLLDIIGHSTTANINLR